MAKMPAVHIALKKHNLPVVRAVSVYSSRLFAWEARDVAKMSTVHIALIDMD